MRSFISERGNRSRYLSGTMFPRLHCIASVDKDEKSPEGLWSLLSRYARADSDLSETRIPVASWRRQKDERLPSVFPSREAFYTLPFVHESPSELGLIVAAVSASVISLNHSQA